MRPLREQGFWDWRITRMRGGHPENPEISIILMQTMMETIMQPVLGKVTAFITRPGATGPEILLFEHPTAGIQLPAGTVEEGETPDQAALREAWEETGVANLQVRAFIGVQEQTLPAGRLAVCHTTKVYARPDLTSFDWAQLRRGIRVQAERWQRDFVQVTYIEWDCFPDPTYISYQITGWAPVAAFCTKLRRHFFHLTIEGTAPDKPPAVFTDHHLYQPFWAPLDNLPAIVEPQMAWLKFVTASLGYSFAHNVGSAQGRAVLRGDASG